MNLIADQITTIMWFVMTLYLIATTIIVGAIMYPERIMFFAGAAILAAAFLVPTPVAAPVGILGMALVIASFFPSRT